MPNTFIPSSLTSLRASSSFAPSRGGATSQAQTNDKSPIRMRRVEDYSQVFQRLASNKGPTPHQKPSNTSTTSAKPRRNVSGSRETKRNVRT